MRAIDNDMLSRALDKVIKQYVKENDLEKVRHSKWMKTYHSGMVVSKGFVSLCCDMWNERKTKFCPYCGAKMDGRPELQSDIPSITLDVTW